MKGLTVVGEDDLDRAEKVLLEALTDHIGAGQEAGPHRLHAEELVRAGSVDDVAGLVSVAGEGLLDEDVLAGIQGEQCVLSMAAVGRGDVDDVDVRVAHQILVAAVAAGDTVPFRESLRTAYVAGTNGDHLLTGVRAEGAHHLIGDPTGAEDAPTERGSGHRVGGPRARQGERHALIVPHDCSAGNEAVGPDA